MANRDGYSVQIFLNENPTYIYKNCGKFGVSLPNNSKYSIQLTNNNSIATDAYLRIDGKKMGAYRIIPNENIAISRPSRRKRDLCFLKQNSEMQSAGLFDGNNPKLGQIEVIFRSGEKYDSEETNISYEYNKQVYRLEDYEYEEEYMNKYKKGSGVKRKKLNLLQEIKLMEPEIDPYEECWSMVTECESAPVEIEENNGFTAYSGVNDGKYKTYQALNYDGNETKITVELEIQKYESL